MRIWKHIPFLCFLCSLLLINSGSPASANGDGDPWEGEAVPEGYEYPQTVEPPPSNGDTEVALDGGRFYARVKLRDDLHRVDAFAAEVKVHPATGQWPGATITNTDAIVETNIFTIVRIRGISVPSQYPSRARPHAQVARERERFDKAIHYLWAQVHNAETLILERVEWVPADKVYLCDVFVNLGGLELNLATMLVNDGHACKLLEAPHWDWGARLVRPLAINE